LQQLAQVSYQLVRGVEAWELADADELVIHHSEDPLHPTTRYRREQVIGRIMKAAGTLALPVGGTAFDPGTCRASLAMRTPYTSTILD